MAAGHFRAAGSSEKGIVQQQIALVFVAFTALASVGSTARAQSPDPWIGTWKANLARSVYSPGPKPTVATLKNESSVLGFKVTIDGVDAQGQPIHTENAGAFDGKDNPVKGAQAPNTTAADHPHQSGGLAGRQNNDRNANRQKRSGAKREQRYRGGQTVRV